MPACRCASARISAGSPRARARAARRCDRSGWRDRACRAPLRAPRRSARLERDGGDVPVAGGGDGDQAEIEHRGVEVAARYSQRHRLLPPVARVSEGELGAEGADDDVLQVRLGRAVERIPPELGVEIYAVALDPLHRRDAAGRALVAFAADVLALGVVDAEAGRAERPELGVPAELGVEVRRVVALVELLAAGRERQAEAGRVVQDRAGGGVGIVDAVLVGIVDRGRRKQGEVADASSRSSRRSRRRASPPRPTGRPGRRRPSPAPGRTSGCRSGCAPSRSPSKSKKASPTVIVAVSRLPSVKMMPPAMSATPAYMIGPATSDRSYSAVSSAALEPLPSWRRP